MQRRAGFNTFSKGDILPKLKVFFVYRKERVRINAHISIPDPWHFVWIRIFGSVPLTNGSGYRYGRPTLSHTDTVHSHWHTGTVLYNRPKGQNSEYGIMYRPCNFLHTLHFLRSVFTFVSRVNNVRVWQKKGKCQNDVSSLEGHGGGGHVELETETNSVFIS